MGKNQRNGEGLQIIGKRIMEKRKSLQMSRDKLAEKCGVAMETIKRIENGNDFSVGTLLQIIKVLDYPANLLIGFHNVYNSDSISQYTVKLDASFFNDFVELIVKQSERNKRSD